MDQRSAFFPLDHSRLLIAGLVAGLLVAGCASPPPAGIMDDTVAESEPVAPPPEPEGVTEVYVEPQAVPAEPRRASLNPAHPDRYVVKRGDTLWDISAMFLKDPWYWPEIWYVNPQIANPHLIYPGDVISLVYIDGRPRLILERGNVVRLSPRVREVPLDEAIQTIPLDKIRAFLQNPAVLDKDTVRNAPYLVTTRRGHLVHGAGSEVYVRGTEFADGAEYHVTHVGDELRDPDTGELLGYEGIHVGEGTIVRTGDPATMVLNATSREALNGDKLLPAVYEFPLQFVPRPPPSPVQGRIISVTDGVSLIGTYQIVTLNRGSNDGLEPGHVLEIYQAGREERDRFANAGFLGLHEKVRLPEEYSGNLMVFKTYEDISYALIMQAENDIHVLDIVRSP